MNRLVERFMAGKFIKCEMRDLVVDDVFRLFEPNGTPVDLGKMWMVLEKPYLTDGIWGVSCEPIIGVISTGEGMDE